MDKVIEWVVYVSLLGVFALLLIPMTGCGSILPKGVELNAGIMAMDEGQTSRVSHRKTSPAACFWNKDYCFDDKEEKGS